MSEKFLENATIEAAFVPVDMQDGANNGDWVSLENYKRCLVVLYKDAGTAGDDPVFKLQQATAADGTGAKDLDFTVVHQKVGTLSSVTSWTRTTQTAATSYTNAASAESEAIICVEIDAAMLDVDNSFKFIQLSVADVGTNAQLGCGFYILFDPRYPQSSPISALS